VQVQQQRLAMDACRIYLTGLGTGFWCDMPFVVHDVGLLVNSTAELFRVCEGFSGLCWR
jgi:hypothetical protein